MQQRVIDNHEKNFRRKYKQLHGGTKNATKAYKKYMKSKARHY